MSKIIESQSSEPARPRAGPAFPQPRPAVVLGVVALLLTVSFCTALGYMRTPLSSPAATTCTPAASPVATTAQVTVNVYNATNRAGLAAATARLLREQGFVVAAVQNDPAGKPVAQPAVVRFGSDGEAGAQRILALVSGAVPAQDSRADGSVDVVLGDGFTALAALPATAATASPC